MTVAKLAGGVKRRKELGRKRERPTRRGGSRTAPTNVLAPDQSQGLDLPGLHMEVDGLSFADGPQDHILQ